MSDSDSDNGFLKVVGKQNTIISILNNVFFSKVPPTTSTMAFQIYKSIYMVDRTRFKVLADIHQNNMGDPLHFSMEVDLGGWLNRLHFNGFYKNGFKVVNITATTKDLGSVITETVATYDV